MIGSIISVDNIFILFLQSPLSPIVVHYDWSIFLFTASIIDISEETRTIVV